ncbi:DUF6414 family protein [Vibrio coralliilyticus]|uniref:DUF6414 family protein n=1 Tax=Vibrio coralliilyticus TaxID=190893 RepID=UPI00155FA1A5|nr:hypothetical protein [Vibrio coralliilyticus]NRF60933.1 hypothetical protein [Vibrio coralliilyticus]
MIKNFIYLDEQKLYSFSSQLFEGITDYVLNEQYLDKATEKSSKDGTPITSSQVIANVIRETSRTTEKKFLHDHAFNLFEQEVLSTDQLLDLTTAELSSLDSIANTDKPFVKIKAQGHFIDLQELSHLFSYFNDIGQAVAVLPLTQEFQELETLKVENKQSKAVKDLQSKLDKQVRTLKANGLSLPSTSTQGFKTILEHFGDNIVRFQQDYGSIAFTSCLDSSSLREPLKAIYRKYSRKTAKEFTVIATVSHAIGTQDVTSTTPPEGSNMLAHFKEMGEHLYDLEQKFTGKGENEVLLEPIAIYTEL